LFDPENMNHGSLRRNSISSQERVNETGSQVLFIFTISFLDPEVCLLGQACPVIILFYEQDIFCQLDFVKARTVISSCLFNL